MPIYELWRQAIGSEAAATVFLVVLIVILFFVINAVQQTSSHMIWAFARDDAIVLSRPLAIMHPTLEVPVWALIANAAIVFVFGCIYLASSAAFNALVNTCIVLQAVSYAIPCALLMARGRSADLLLEKRYFKLPHWLGWAANAITVIWATMELVFFSFPTTLPTTGSGMSKIIVMHLLFRISVLINV
jgi:choline transport protein